MDNNEKVLFDEVCVNANESDIGTNAIIGGGWCGGLLCGGAAGGAGCGGGCAGAACIGGSGGLLCGLLC